MKKEIRKLDPIDDIEDAACGDMASALSIEDSTAAGFWQAYAIAPDPDNPLTWRLFHHTGKVKRAITGKIGYEHTVDWNLVAVCVEMLSRSGYNGQRVDADESLIIHGARHLASHYIKAGKPLPDVLAALM